MKLVPDEYGSDDETAAGEQARGTESDLQPAVSLNPRFTLSAEPCDGQRTVTLSDGRKITSVGQEKATGA